jgi:hypothetical protein
LCRTASLVAGALSSATCRRSRVRYQDSCHPPSNPRCVEQPPSRLCTQKDKADPPRLVWICLRPKLRRYPLLPSTFSRYASRRSGRGSGYSQGSGSRCSRTLPLDAAFQHPRPHPPRGADPWRCPGVGRGWYRSVRWPRSAPYSSAGCGGCGSRTGFRSSRTQ